MSDAPLCHFACPLCGADNGCLPAATGTFATHCWCADVTIDPRTLARIDDAARGRACLCRRCAVPDDVRCP